MFSYQNMFSKLYFLICKLLRIYEYEFNQISRVCLYAQFVDLDKHLNHEPHNRIESQLDDHRTCSPPSIFKVIVEVAVLKLAGGRCGNQRLAWTPHSSQILEIPRRNQSTICWILRSKGRFKICLVLRLQVHPQGDA